MSCVPHPNADRLRVTTVNVGGDALLPIVCGAPNVAEGQKVVVALVGTEIQMPGKESFVIGKAKIRGEVSEGMICAEDELHWLDGLWWCALVWDGVARCCVGWTALGGVRWCGTDALRRLDGLW